MAAATGFLRELLDNPNFVKWFGNSAVRDAEGLPLEVYHSTPGVFDTFSKRILGKNWKNKNDKLGFYFTDDPAVAEDFGSYAAGVNPEYKIFEKKIIEDAQKSGDWTTFRQRLENTPIMRENPYSTIPGYLKFNRPLELNGNDITDEWWKIVGPELKSKYYDSAILHGVDSGATGQANYYIATSPTQFKSRFNRGTFDPTDPNFLKSAALATSGAGLLSLLSPNPSQASTGSPSISPDAIASARALEYLNRARGQAAEETWTSPESIALGALFPGGPVARSAGQMAAGAAFEPASDIGTGFLSWLSKYQNPFSVTP